LLHKYQELTQARTGFSYTTTTTSKAKGIKEEEEEKVKDKPSRHFSI
jgi:hypothetical protein